MDARLAHLVTVSGPTHRMVRLGVTFALNSVANPPHLVNNLSVVLYLNHLSHPLVLSQDHFQQKLDILIRQDEVRSGLPSLPLVGLHIHLVSSLVSFTLLCDHVNCSAFVFLAYTFDSTSQHHMGAISRLRLTLMSRSRLISQIVPYTLLLPRSHIFTRL